MSTVRHPSLERQSIPLVTWALLIAVLLLAGAVGALGLYLNGRRIALDHRQAVADQRDERQRLAICGILEQFPPGRNAQLDNARRVFACTATISFVAPTPHRTPTPRPTRTVTVTPTPQVIVTPGPPRLIVTPGPTVTVTKTPHRPKHPTPTPTCTTVNVTSMCLPIPHGQLPLGGLLHLPH